MRNRQAAMLGAALMVAACSREAPAPGALSADDDRRLNQAAEMLDANAVDANMVDADVATNEVVSDD